MQIIAPYPDLDKLRFSLLSDYAFEETNQWNAKSIFLPNEMGKGNLYMYNSHGIQFMRAKWNASERCFFRSSDPVGKTNLIDFRIDSDGAAYSSYLEGDKKYEWEVTKINGLRLMIPKKYIHLKKEEILKKFNKYCYHPKISILIQEILNMPLDSFQSCIKLEWKLLEFSYYYIDFINNVDIAQHFEELNPSKTKAIRNTQSIIEENYNESLSIKELSRKVGLNTHYLKKYFKDITGMSIRQYFIKLRMEKAKELLICTRKPIAEICSEIGYNSQAHFTRTFKKAFDSCPQEFRLTSAQTIVS